MHNVIFNITEIEREFLEAERLLLSSQQIIPIIYNEFDYTTFDEQNKEFLNSIKNKPLVYSIWCGESPELMTIKYIGHVQATSARARMRNHLGKHNTGTGAKVLNVIEELSIKKHIGVSTLLIEPAYMRKSLEEWLILRNAANLPWNKSGKKH